ncbi:MAG: asparagine synthase B [Bacteroidaceae bacterium]|nr:asparagine synthase B [Bacteroidaceae bacterium]
MCGFVAILKVKGDARQAREKALKMSRKIRHRGPDWSGVYSSEKAVLAHERLAIVDPLSGGQPLYSSDGKKVLAVNGEIYNHQEIRRLFAGQYEFQTGSDCEVILALYERYGTDFIDKLNGIFSFVLYDSTTDDYLIARDPIGVIPLYIGHDKDGTVYAASELKALEGQCEEYKPFPPGHYLCSMDVTANSPLTTVNCQLPTVNFHRWYERDWMQYDGMQWATSDRKEAVQMVKEGLMAAVKRQLMSDVPYGVLLSGGLDSSVVSAIAKLYAAKRIETNDKHDAWWPQLHSFAVGLKGAPDLAKAQEVAKHIGTVHHEVNYTVQEGLDAIRDVIYYTETYDVTTVRASTPMYLLARVIRSMGIKMVLSGEGADEIFGGYLYFHKAPDAKAFHEETVRKLKKLHFYDCLRANKSLMAWGIEGRVPFLDKEFLDVAMRIDPVLKMCGPLPTSPEGGGGFKIEKAVVREGFADLLPESVAWRQKEQFSDGVGYSWIDTLKKVTAEAVSDEQMAHAAERFPINPPLCKEEYYYRSIFEEHFPSPSAARSVNQEASVACSTAIALEWDAAFKNMNDPSGRAVKGVHEQAY